MRRLFPLLWFLLVPYFAVGGLNVRPWIGESRESANRTNAQLILALILVCPLILISPRAGWLAEATRIHPRIFALLLLIPAWWFVSAWLKGERERQYEAAYRSLPRWQRFAFGLSTPTLLVVALVLVASNAPAKHTPKPQSSDLSCDHAATEMTADACTLKSR
jgi:hypothetical protein